MHYIYFGLSTESKVGLGMTGTKIQVISFFKSQQHDLWNMYKWPNISTLRCFVT